MRRFAFVAIVILLLPLFFVAVVILSVACAAATGPEGEQ